MEYLSPVEIPETFKRWAGTVLVSGALERRVWAWGRGFKIHPNLFTLLIAPPGVGKNVAIDPVNELWSATGKLNVLPNRSTCAAFLEASASFPQYVEIAEERFITNPSVLALGEFGHLFQDADPVMMNAINAFYDAKDTPFTDRTISRGSVTIDRPILNLIAGTQPQYLDRVLPEQAFQLGFATRLTMCYAAESSMGTVFGEHARPQQSMFDAIVQDLIVLKDLCGQYEFDQEAADLFEAWYQGGCEPLPDHPRLADYNTRRWASAFKLAIIMTAAKSSAFIVHAEEVHAAIEFLTQSEGTLPEAFAAMRGESDSANINETRAFVFREYIRSKQPVREQLIVGFLAHRMPSHRVMPLLETMIAGGLLKQKGSWPRGMREFLPGDNQEIL